MKLRSLLYVPAHSERFLAKAHERGADAIILDLEDAVPEADKDRARDGLVEAVKSVRRNGAKVLVRINAGTRRRSDAEAAARAGADAIMLAKAETGELDAYDLPLLATLEDPAAVLDARKFARHRAVMGLVVGSEDLATALGATPIPEVLRFPKLLAHYAAKAEGKLSFGLLRSVAELCRPRGHRSGRARGAPARLRWRDVRAPEHRAGPQCRLCAKPRRDRLGGACAGGGEKR